MEDLNKEIAEKVRELEEKGLIIKKYEKGQKPYREPKYVPVGKKITCQKCGSTHNLMKHVDATGEEFWFCKQCVIERAREIATEKRRK